jgi:hypothetical protein
MIAAIYARKSTDQSDRNEDAKSVTPGRAGSRLRRAARLNCRRRPHLRR